MTENSSKSKNTSNPVLAGADTFLDCCDRLDFQSIFENQKDALRTLRVVMDELDLTPLTKEQLKSLRPAEPITVDSSVVSHVASTDPKEERRQEIIDEIEAQGFGDRLDKVYDSFADGRTRVLSKVPHRHGLPFFNTVIAADFAPVSGLHGIFISNSEVISAVLPYPCEGHHWQLEIRRNYSSLSEMVEYVTLLSAGFELP